MFVAQLFVRSVCPSVADSLSFGSKLPPALEDTGSILVGTKISLWDDVAYM